MRGRAAIEEMSNLLQVVERCVHLLDESVEPLQMLLQTRKTTEDSEDVQSHAELLPRHVKIRLSPEALSEGTMKHQTLAIPILLSNTIWRL